MFKVLMNDAGQAIAYSKRALRQAEASGTDNRTTRMHELVEYLQQLRK